MFDKSVMALTAASLALGAAALHPATAVAQPDENQGFVRPRNRAFLLYRSLFLSVSDKEVLEFRECHPMRISKRAILARSHFQGNRSN